MEYDGLYGVVNAANGELLGIKLTRTEADQLADHLERVHAGTVTQVVRVDVRVRE